MPTYLDRYLAGEHEWVWDELMSLGAAVREEPLYSDALAVARETMRRARANVLLLIARPGRIGYLFGYAFLQPPAFWPVGRREREWLGDSLTWAHEQPPLLGESVAEVEEEVADMRAHLERMRQHGQAPRLVGHLERGLSDLEARVGERLAALDAVEREVGALPISLRAWYEWVGGVNFVGLHSGWLRLLDPAEEDVRQRYEFAEGDVGVPFHRLSGLHPLYVTPLDANRAAKDATHPGFSRYELRPEWDALYGDHGRSSPCVIELPGLSADTALRINQRETTFVSYLRESFRWGGFPGWEGPGPEPPEQDLRFLTEGLLPI